MRFVRLNTSHTNFLADRQRFYDRLRARGHPVAVLEKSFPKIVNSDRARFLATKPEALERKRITAFVTTLDPKTLALQLNKLAKENWHLVSNSKDTPTLKHNVMVTYRNPDNLLALSRRLRNAHKQS